MKDVIAAIREIEGKALILTHHNADIDAVGSMIALFLGLRQKGVKADMAAAESVSKSARKIAEGHEILIDPDCSEYDTVIVLETSVPEQLSSVRNLRADIIIDHHLPGPLADRARTWIDENEKSAAQMVYQLLKKMGCKIDRHIAEAVAAGLVADTSHLRHAGKKEFSILLELLEEVSYQDILERIETRPDESERIACIKTAKRLELHKIGPLLVVFSSMKSHEAAACRALLRIGADIAVVATERKGELRISSRGRREILQHGIDLSEIFKEVGSIIGGSGGGHDLAGSANGKGNREKAFDFVLKTLENKLKKQ